MMGFEAAASDVFAAQGLFPAHGPNFFCGIRVEAKLHGIPFGGPGKCRPIPCMFGKTRQVAKTPLVETRLNQAACPFRSDGIGFAFHPARAQEARSKRNAAASTQENPRAHSVWASGDFGKATGCAIMRRCETTRLRVRRWMLWVAPVLFVFNQSCASMAGLAGRERAAARDSNVQASRNGDARKSPLHEEASNASPYAGLAQSGQASWYGPGFHGKLTASGEIYDERAMTAAHNFLPFGSRAKVTHVTTGRSVEVRINDRGPFVPGRIIDLSRAAARALGILESGIARVRVEGLGASPSASGHTAR
jgi:hypothetical protein